jgi:hypothetical protein
MVDKRARAGNGARPLSLGGRQRQAAATFQAFMTGVRNLISGGSRQSETAASRSLFVAVARHLPQREA